MAPALTNNPYADTASDSVTNTTRASARQSVVGTLQSARRATLRSGGESDITITLSKSETMIPYCSPDASTLRSVLSGYYPYCSRVLLYSVLIVLAGLPRAASILIPNHL
jgi:hypothetical protein